MGKKYDKGDEMADTWHVIYTHESWHADQIMYMCMHEAQLQERLEGFNLDRATKLLLCLQHADLYTYLHHAILGTTCMCDVPGAGWRLN